MANSTGRSKVSGHLELPKIIKEIKKFIKMEKFCIEVRGDEDDNMKEFFGKRIKNYREGTQNCQKWSQKGFIATREKSTA